MARLDFGKYKGMDIGQVPAEYLEWLIENSKKRMKECQSELDRRTLSEEANLSWMEKLVQTGFRELAKRHHPDAGGTHAEIQEINAAYQKLKTTVKK